jgi:hypothetical protein
MEPAITFDNLKKFLDDGRVYLCELSSNLSLYHYRSCTDDDSSDLKQCRGIVFDDQGNRVMRGFPYTPEYDADDTTFESKYANTFSYYRFFDSYEGTIIRVFYHGTKWYVSTHKRFDADNSKWAGTKSFEKIFRSAIDHIAKNNAEAKFQDYDSFFNVLEKENQYLFLITSTVENRVVSVVNQPNNLVFHVGTYADHHFTFNTTIPGIPFPPERPFTTPSELVKFVKQMNPMYCQGIVAISTTHGCFKVISTAYSYLYKLRANQPNLRLRYLQIRVPEAGETPEAHMVKFSSFLSLYHDHALSFQEIEKTIHKAVMNIHTTYIRRFIQKQFAVLPPLQYEILKKCHTEYIQTHDPVTPKKVYDMLMKETSESLYKIITF